MGCFSVFAFILLDLGIIACLISFCAPFWVHNSSIVATGLDFFKDSLNSIGVKTDIPAFSHEGLWGHCTSDLNCVGVWENDFFMQRFYPSKNFFK